MSVVVGNTRVCARQEAHNRNQAAQMGRGIG